LRIFITGATGFIGRHLCRALHAQGHQIIALVRSPHKIPPELKEHIQVVPGDLSIFSKSCTLPEADIFIHLAAVIAGKNQKEYGDINFRSVQELLLRLREQSWQPKRFIFASSLAAMGPSPEGHIWTEEDTPQPNDPYGAAKLQAEALMEEQPFPTTIFRPPIVLGAGDTATLTLYKVVKSGIAFLPAGAPQALSFIDIDDLVQGIVTLCDDDSKEHRTYFIASDELVTNAQMLHAIAKSMGKKVRILGLPRPVIYTAMLASTFFSKIFRFTNQLDSKQYKQMTAPAFLCSGKQLQKDTQWKPRSTLDETIDKAVKGYREMGWL